jgi:hypothetical protein
MFNRGSEQPSITEPLKRRIDLWITREGRNQYGDPEGTVYAGGNPLFDERSPRMRDRYEYILSRHPELKQDG